MMTEMEPKNREEGTDELAANYANNTPGQSKEPDSTFNPRQMTFKEFMKQNGQEW